jgi:hypothetical protein
MGYCLSPAVSFAFVGERAIFLDLSADRYFCLAPPQQGALNVLIAGNKAERAAENDLEPLVTRGILIEVAEAGRVAACKLASVPTSSLVDDGLPRAQAWRIAEAALRVKAARFALRHGSLNRMIAALVRVKSRVGGREIHLSRMTEIAAAFEQTNLLLSPLRQCLPRSLALATRLAGLGANIDLVLGVANNPFSAHAWVQHKQVVLNDRLEKVRGYTPVLVV